MQIINVKQGSPEWLELRLKHNTASEAPVMMGVSKKCTRNELLRMKATGDEKEFSEWVKKNLLQKGHDVEALARPIANKIIDDDLFPITAIDDDGILLSSYDGTTMDEVISWECKLWNEEKAATVRAGDVPEEDYWQVVQQLMVGTQKCLYMVTDGTEENTVYVWKELTIDDATKLRAGWEQFDEDLANYQHVEKAEPVAAEPVKGLPAVSVQVSGEISIIDNFEAFEVALRDFVDNRLVRKPKTDQDFVNLDSQIKALKVAESALDAAEANMLSQVSTVDAMKRTKDMLHKLARDNRLVAEKLLKAEKDNRRGEILQGGRDALVEHIAQIDNTLGGKITLPVITADFAGAMKGKRTIASLQDAVDTTLANAKIESNQIADKIRLNLESLRADAEGYESLFADAQSLVMKENEDLKNLIAARIAEHKQAEQARLDAEREKIREEEAAKARAKVEEERAERERLEQEQQEPVASDERPEPVKEEGPVVEPAEEVVQPVATERPAVKQTANAAAPEKEPDIAAYARGNKVILSTIADNYRMSIKEAQTLIDELSAAVNSANAAA